MPSQPDFGLLGNIGASVNVNDTVMQSLFGAQKLQQNQSVLDEQVRADAAREAQAKLVADPAADDATFEQLLAPIALFNPAQAAQMRRQRQMQADAAALGEDPSAFQIGRFGMRYPEALKSMQDAWSIMDAGQKEAATKASADVYGYLDAGDADGAIKILEQHMAAAKSTGEDVSAYPQLIDRIRKDPNSAKVIAGLNLSLGIGPEKFAETYGKLGEEKRAEELQPSKVAEAEATARIKGTEADFAPKKAQSELESASAQRQKIASDIANDTARVSIERDKLDLDRDTLTSTIQLKLEELAQKGTDLSPGAQTTVNAAVSEAQSAQALADRSDDLAGKLVGQSMASGWTSTVREFGKGLWGQQDAVSAIRQEYERLRNQQAVKNLPPGPASDKDIELAKQGFPPPNAKPQYIHDFLRGMAKMQREVAAAADRKANWIASNGSLAPARRDVDIGGVQVPAGTTFNEFDRSTVKRRRQGEAPAGIQSIISKYGTGGR